MKHIYKILISILLMSMLVMAATVVTSADTATPVSTNASDNNIINLGDAPVAEINEAKLPTAAEEKARFENRMKLAPKALENITAQKSTTPRLPIPKVQTATVNAIPTDVSYSNPVTGISTFGTYFSPGYIDSGNFVNWKTYSFYLPVASYVYTDISGSIYYVNGYAYYSAYIDSDYLQSEYQNGACNSDYYCYLSIQKSRLTYMTKGWHTLYIDGYAGIFSGVYYYPFGYISIIAQPEYTAITVTSPNGYENWYRGQTKSITWKKDGQPGANVKIELYKAGVLSTVISSLTPNDGVYSWYIPTYTPIGTDYKIKISSTSEPTKYYDWSNNNFKIS